MKWLVEKQDKPEMFRRHFRAKRETRPLDAIAARREKAELSRMFGGPLLVKNPKGRESAPPAKLG